LRLLDLFCGAGGAAMGYSRAGFEVVGVDHLPQKHYPFEFHQADALEYLAKHGREFDVVHASPPCQAYSRTHAMRRQWVYSDILAPTRGALMAVASRWVIENVPGAPMRTDLLLCGTMFGLRSKWGPVHRHRVFESNVGFLLSPASCNHAERAMNIYTSGDARNGTEREFIDAMGVTWAGTADGLESIPPAYTEWIGKQLLVSLSA